MTHYNTYYRLYFLLNRISKNFFTNVIKMALLISLLVMAHTPAVLWTVSHLLYYVSKVDTVRYDVPLAPLEHISIPTG